MRSSTLALSALLLAAGCTVHVQNPPPRGAQPTRAQPAPPPATARPAPPPARPAGRLLTLTIHPKDLRVKGNVVVYKPGRSVKRARYHTWRFPRAQFQRVVGPQLAGITRLRVRELRVTRRTHKPADPRMASPAGGFTIVVHHARAVKVLQVTTLPTVRKPRPQRHMRVVRLLPRKTRPVKGWMVFSPHMGVKRARYVHYRMTMGSFRRVLGPRIKRPVKVQLDCGAPKRKTSGTNLAAAPAGGITVVTHTCRVTGKVGLSTTPRGGRVITLVPRRMRVIPGKRIARMLPNTRVRRATYTRWQFTWKSYRRVVGLRAPKRPLKVRVLVLDRKVVRRKPANPRAASPQGGFRHVKIKARILDRVR